MNSYYEIVGYERKCGTSKKSGKNYDIGIFYCMHQNPIDGVESCGKRCESFVYNFTLLGELPFSFSVGDHIMPIYNRSGYLCELRKV